MNLNTLVQFLLSSPKGNFRCPYLSLGASLHSAGTFFTFPFLNSVLLNDLFYRNFPAKGPYNFFLDKVFYTFSIGSTGNIINVCNLKELTYYEFASTIPVRECRNCFLFSKLCNLRGDVCSSYTDGILDTITEQVQNVSSPFDNNNCI